MKHQITFIGGQLLPIYIGIKEFSPEVIHCIVSSESQPKVSYLRQLLPNIVINEKVCNPYDYVSILNSCQEILKSLSSSDDVLINLTGGTKIMVLTAQYLIHENKLSGFYVNQDESILSLPNYNIQKLNCQISTKEFLELVGHKITKSKDLSDFSIQDFQAVEDISNFTIKNYQLIMQINSKIRKAYSNLSQIPNTGSIQINNSNVLNWNSNNLWITRTDKEIFRVQSSRIRSLFFHASWWELKVAKEISKWGRVNELLIQCELPFKVDNSITKNEIDVLINIGGKLIFVECKSGIVKQEDINKMKIVKDTYGGIASKSLLVARFKPKDTILEKCKELNVDVFFIYDNIKQINKLESIIGLLDSIHNKLVV